MWTLVRPCFTESYLWFVLFLLDLGRGRCGLIAGILVFGCFFFDQKFSVTAVAAGFIPRDADDREDGVALAEDGVHLFQRTVLGFWVEEVDYWDDEGVAEGDMLVSLNTSLVLGIERSYITAKIIYVLYLIESNATGVIITTRKLNAQFAEVETALPGARIRSGS